MTTTEFASQKCCLGSWYNEAILLYGALLPTIKSDLQRKMNKIVYYYALRPEKSINLHKKLVCSEWLFSVNFPLACLFADGSHDGRPKSEDGGDADPSRKGPSQGTGPGRKVCVCYHIFKHRWDIMYSYILGYVNVIISCANIYDKVTLGDVCIVIIIIM